MIYGIPSIPLVRTVGALIIVDFEPEPIIVRLLLIVSCSVYVPGNTLITSPSLAAFIAS
jgi:hypothetical protein